MLVCARSLVEWGSEGSETKFRRRIRALLVDWLVVSAESHYGLAKRTCADTA